MNTALPSRAVLIATVAAVVVCSGCGGGANTMGTRPVDSVAVPYDIVGANEVPKHFSDANLDYIITRYPNSKDGVLSNRFGSPVSLAHNCIDPKPTVVDFAVAPGVGSGEQHFFILNNLPNVRMIETTTKDAQGNTIPAGRLLITGDGCIETNWGATVFVRSVAGSSVADSNKLDIFGSNLR